MLYVLLVSENNGRFLWLHLSLVLNSVKTVISVWVGTQTAQAYLLILFKSKISFLLVGVIDSFATLEIQLVPSLILKHWFSFKDNWVGLFGTLVALVPAIKMAIKHCVENNFACSSGVFTGYDVICDLLSCCFLVLLLLKLQFWWWLCVFGQLLPIMPSLCGLKFCGDPFFCFVQKCWWRGTSERSAFLWMGTDPPSFGQLHHPRSIFG